MGGEVRAVVPSQVCAAIVGIFPHVSSGNGSGTYTAEHAGRLRAILELIAGIPAQLLPAGAKYAEFITERSNIEEMLPRWAIRPPDQLLRDPVWKIYKILLECPDEWPPPVHAELPFISDIDLRLSIARDIGSAERAAAAFEWKVTTVMAGSAAEALLLWKIQQIESSDPAKVAAARATLRQGSKALDEASLAALAALALELALIQKLTWSAVELAREYRNLIHPGRAQRKSMVCDRATALSALCGVAHVVRDFS